MKKAIKKAAAKKPAAKKTTAKKTATKKKTTAKKKGTGVGKIKTAGGICCPVGPAKK